MCDPKSEGGRRCSHKGKAARQHAALLSAARYRKSKGEQDAATALLTQADQLQKASDEHGQDVILHHMDITPATQKVMDALSNASLSGYIVGGSVRDSLLGSELKDVDIEVYGGDVNQVAKALKRLGKVDQVGKSFGVLKIAVNGEDFDVSLPRLDSKTGEGHRGFEIQVDPNLSFEEATARRDFTLNSLMYDPRLGVIIDPHGGYEDLKNGVLRHTSEAFGEDPLRVLRGVQMAARFNMTMHPETIELSKRLLPEAGTLAVERVSGEMEKLYRKSTSPSKGFRVLKETGWDACFAGLAEVNDEALHSELDRVANSVNSSDRVASYSAVILKRLNGGDAQPFLEKTVVGDDEKRKARKLAAAPPQDLRPYTVRDWADKALYPVTVRQWYTVNKENPQIVRAAAKYGVEHKFEEPLLMGRTILEKYPDRKPGPWMGTLLKQARDAQYSGVFRTQEGALAWLEANIEG